MDEPYRCALCREPATCYFRRSGEEYFRCSGCGLITRKGHWYQEERVSAADYYENIYFDKLAGDQVSGNRDRLFSNILDEIERNMPTGSLLDVGCGCGFFLGKARDRGWKVQGVEPSPKSVSHLQSVQGDISVVAKLDQIEPQEGFDVITLINVLDHMLEPWREIERLSKYLKTGGLLYLRFPNGLFHASVFLLLQRVRRERLAKQLTIFHQHSFVPVFIRQLLSSTGFDDIRLKNAPLSDSVRISPHWPAMANEAFRRMIGLAARSVEFASLGRYFAGPSLEVRARKK
jgi:2-polyprenyl-3-methyl-5-hydroxy-6-metoxy-1,4-benzoquinol methylase